jgi:hypothetical protein
VVDGAFQEVGYCFLTSAQARLISDGLKKGVGVEARRVPVRMVWKSSTGRHVEMIEHEEGREVSQLGRPDAAAYSCACPFRLLNCQEGLANCACDCYVGFFSDFV